MSGLADPMVGLRVPDAALKDAQARARHELAILDTPREDRFARAVRLARRLFDVPIVGSPRARASTSRRAAAARCSAARPSTRTTRSWCPTPASTPDFG